jgi:hypothetical protein
MISWITGSRINNVVEDVQNSGMYEPSYPAEPSRLTRQIAFYDASEVDQPQTPAPVFAVRAFKHAIFGTPKPHEDQSMLLSPEKRRAGKNTSPRKLGTRRSLDFHPSTNYDIPDSPTKNLNSILITPGQGPTRRKTVSFGGDVKDNEGKRGTRSGLPADFPGKFPSPWTPRTDTPLVKKPASLEQPDDSKATSQAESKVEAKVPEPEQVQKPRAKDDTDITLDMSEPRSESGRFWKEQYYSYAEKSEKEMLKMATKQKIAKNYAKKKDEEAMQLTNRLADEKRKAREREEEMGSQIKDFQERLRRQLAENHSLKAEMAVLKQRLESLEGGQSKESQHMTKPEKQSRTELGESKISEELPRSTDRKRPPVVREQRPRRNTSPSIPERRSSSAAPLTRHTTSTPRDSAHTSAQLERSRSLVASTRRYHPPSRMLSTSPRKQHEKSGKDIRKIASKENLPPSKTVIPSPSALEPGPPYFGRMGLEIGSQTKGASVTATSKTSITAGTSLLSARGTKSGAVEALDMAADRKAAALERIKKRKEARQKDTVQLR